MQFGFMEGKWMVSYAIFIRTRCKKQLCLAIVDLGEVFDHLPRDVVRWALRKIGIEEWLVDALLSGYAGAKKHIKTSCLDSNCFINVVDVISKEIRDGLSWELLYADDVHVVLMLRVIKS